MLEKLKSGSNMWNPGTCGMKGKTTGNNWAVLLNQADSQVEAYQKKQKPEEEETVSGRNRLETERNIMMHQNPRIMQFQKLSTDKYTAEVRIPGKVEYKAGGLMSEETLIGMAGERGKAPYSMLADPKTGKIEYNGVEYYCDFQKNQICLGDMTDIDNILNIPLSGGGRLMLNRNNLDDLEKSIKLFSPEDISIIMQAIATDNKMRQIQQELEDEASGLKVLKDKKEGSVTNEDRR